MIVKKSVSIFVFGFFAYLLIVLPVFTHATTDLGMHSGHTGGVNIVYYQVTAPADVRIGEDVPIEIHFVVHGEILADHFDIRIHGAGINLRWVEKDVSDLNRKEFNEG